MKKTWEEKDIPKKECLLTATAFQSNVLTANLVGRSHTHKPKVVASFHGAKASLATADLNLAKDQTKTGVELAATGLQADVVKVSAKGVQGGMEAGLSANVTCAQAQVLKCEMTGASKQVKVTAMQWNSHRS